MQPPTCPHCSAPLDRVLDLPYGYWEWNGAAYALKTTSESVDVAPWVCSSCMHDLRNFHPQDTFAPQGADAS